MAKRGSGSRSKEAAASQADMAEEKQREVSRETDLMFDVGSSVLDETRRFEKAVAIHRALYTEGDGRAG